MRWPGLVRAEQILVVQGNPANSYQRLCDVLNMYRHAYYGWVKLYGKEDEHALIAANNHSLALLQPRNATKKPSSPLREQCPWRDVSLGENVETTLRMRLYAALVLCQDPGHTLDSSPRGRGDARGDGTDRPARLRRHANRSQRSSGALCARRELPRCPRLYSSSPGSRRTQYPRHIISNVAFEEGCKHCHRVYTRYAGAAACAT